MGFLLFFALGLASGAPATLTAPWLSVRLI